MTQAPAPGTGTPRVHRRTLTTRLVGAAGAALFVGGAIAFAANGRPTAGTLGLAALAVLSLVNLAGAWADRYVFDADGFEHRNALFQKLGLRARRVAWSDVERVWQHRRPLLGAATSARPTALFLRLRSGRRVVLDSLEDFDEILATVERRAGRN
jgi:hypothetical protein